MRATTLWTQWQRIFLAGPRCLAVIDASIGKTWTRSRLHRLALDLAQQELAEASQRRVALCWSNSITWLAAFLAVQKQGGSVLPLDAGTPAAAQQSTALEGGADWLFSEQLGLVRLRNTRRNQGEVCIKLTSGSSGRPKRIFCQASHLLADGRNIIRSMEITPRDRNLALIPLGHSYGLGNLVMPLLLQGSPLVLAPSFVPSQIPEWIKRYHITVFPSVPAVFRVLAQRPGHGRMQPLRLAISAAAPLPAETAQAFQSRFGLRLHNFYGSSETGGICFDRSGESSLQGTALGRPLTGVRIQVLRQGAIRVHSAAVATRSASFTLADVGAWTNKGELRFIGRKGEVANLGGKKVQPGEIENALRAIPNVTEAWVTVIGLMHRPYLAAAVESTVKAETIYQQLALALPNWKLPRIIKTRPVFPRTERGKLDTPQLIKWLEH